MYIIVRAEQAQWKSYWSYVKIEKNLFAKIEHFQ